VHAGDTRHGPVRTILVGTDFSEEAALATSWAARVLEGAPGAQRNAVALAAGAALCVAGRAADLAEGVSEAQRLLESGAAGALLERWIAFLAEPGAAT